jgi:hypothetical protein
MAAGSRAQRLFTERLAAALPRKAARGQRFRRAIPLHALMEDF